MNTVRTNFKTLDTLKRQVDELAKSRVQVGLFADTASRTAEPGRIASNPHLGAVHEFGLSYSVLGNGATITIPERSWLRMPLSMYLGPEIEAKGESWIWLIITRGAKRTLSHLGAIAEDVIQEAFNTAGWGAWPSLAKITKDRKGNARILIESSQMREAVSSRIV